MDEEKNPAETGMCDHGNDPATCEQCKVAGAVEDETPKE